MLYEFKLPDIGEGLHEAEILQWFVSAGDTVEADSPIAEVQTDKAAVEITTPVKGKIKQLGGKEGAKIKVGEILTTLETETPTETAQESPSPAIEPIQSPEKTAQEKPLIKKRIIAPPTVRKKARELNIPIAEVTGTGKAGRITEEDLYRYLNQIVQAAAPPAGPVQANASEERHPIRGLRKVISENMVKSFYTAPQVSGLDECDVTKLVALRKQMINSGEMNGVKLTYLPFIVKAVAKALQAHPIFNASIDSKTNEYIMKKYYHIGIATATKKGLVVPVIRHADQKSILELAIEINSLAEKAHAGTLTREELRGSTFTITNTGAKGGWFATPIINYPEVAILGAHAIKRKPAVVGDEIAIRDVMGISLTFDHRLIDGEPAGQFMHTLGKYLESPELMLVHLR
ncbi:dihydrolipoamide acetyltransferase family protein [Heyndrickxia acidiproducens]|uniref:dihydrolipoamide acetyltransferase family protein n=1 Tax=Heyndrickxia acidiproducens TaxID=1121084 RepID=UPI000375A4A3|nr:dihydrolipoamide acetyltransferase family protein [Heyndrickxia acidiproducens]